jgi:hypothetical protein
MEAEDTARAGGGDLRHRRRNLEEGPVTSSPGIHDQAHSAEEWSHLRRNPLELSSSLRSKRLTEGYYASLALVFKSVKLPQDSQYSTKHRLHSVSSCPSYSSPNLVWPNSVLQYPESGCTVPPAATAGPLPKLQCHRPIP